MKWLARFTIVTWGLIVLNPLTALGQQPRKPGFRSLQELDAHYRKQSAELERRKLADVADLARRLQGAEAEEAYRALFDLAVAQSLYDAAEPAARTYLAREEGVPESQALAVSITLIARANRGEYDQSLADLERFMKQRAAAHIPDDRRLPPPLLFAVGEAYLQRLMQGGRYDIARKVCRLASSNHPDPSVKAYFEARRLRLDLIGKPAPAIEGTDVDGKPIRLADLKGKVILVDFWATWCPPCVAAFPTLRQLSIEYKDQGFVILGVNLDDLAKETADKPLEKSEDVLSTVRWFLVSQRAAWPNLIGKGADAAAKAYQVDTIPASFLIGRDGMILHEEMRGESLAKAVVKALKAPRPKP